MSHSAPPARATSRGRVRHHISVSPLARIGREKVARHRARPAVDRGRQRGGEQHEERDPRPFEPVHSRPALSAGHGQLGDRAGPAPGDLHVERAAEQPGALPGPRDDLLDLGALADQPADPDFQRRLVEAQRDGNRRIRPVGQRGDQVLDDAVGRQLNAGRQRPRVAALP